MVTTVYCMLCANILRRRPHVHIAFMDSIRASERRTLHSVHIVNVDPTTIDDTDIDEGERAPITSGKPAAFLIFATTHKLHLHTTHTYVTRNYKSLSRWRIIALTENP